MSLRSLGPLSLRQGILFSSSVQCVLSILWILESVQVYHEDYRSHWNYMSLTISGVVYVCISIAGFLAAMTQSAGGCLFYIYCNLAEPLLNLNGIGVGLEMLYNNYSESISLLSFDISHKPILVRLYYFHFASHILHALITMLCIYAAYNLYLVIDMGGSGEEFLCFDDMQSNYLTVEEVMKAEQEMYGVKKKVDAPPSSSKKEN